MRHPVQALVLFLILVVVASALLASHQHKPFPLLIDAPDAKPAAWPANANTLGQPHVMMCRPMVLTVGPRKPKPIVRT